ncbi:hypothetical protein B0J13DRAFT_578128 [Dactylonectria estremocensis]|uniref:Uncharacterized protein n=1 Tax=Dactylonectria estremocensis TaxID=1079267 RepID=A0A9P9CZZ5_9HYPO|nr:hypothetical protein B0J13DRAFT_578128 [Dactylonectria estremocensis]
MSCAGVPLWPLRWRLRCRNSRQIPYRTRMGWSIASRILPCSMHGMHDILGAPGLCSVQTRGKSPVEMSEDPMRNARLISGTVRATSQVFSPSHLIDHQLSHDTRDVLQHPHSMPTTTAIQNRIAERPASNPRSGSQSHFSTQEPSASPQHDRQLELSPSQQPKLPSPEPREEAKTNDGGLGSVQQPLTQDLSPFQPHSLEPISGAIETPCCPQYGNSPPHPPQTVPDPTVIQRYGTSIQEAPSSQQLLESPKTGLPHQPSPSPPSNVIMVGRVPAASTSIPQAVPAQQDHSSPRTRLPTPMTAENTLVKWEKMR